MGNNNNNISKYTDGKINHYNNTNNKQIIDEELSEEFPDLDLVESSCDDMLNQQEKSNDSKKESE